MDRWVQSFTSQNFDSRLASVAQHDSRLASVAQQISAEDLTAPQPLEGQRMSHGLAQSGPSGKLVRKKKLIIFFLIKNFKTEKMLFSGLLCESVKIFFST